MEASLTLGKQMHFICQFQLIHSGWVQGREWVSLHLGSVCCGWLVMSDGCHGDKGGHTCTCVPDSLQPVFVHMGQLRSWNLGWSVQEYIKWGWSIRGRIGPVSGYHESRFKAFSLGVSRYPEKLFTVVKEQAVLQPDCLGSGLSWVPWAKIFNLSEPLPLHLWNRG